MKINSPAELRSILLQTMAAVIEGKMSVPQANAVVGLSSEAHKSIRQQWDMTLHLAENPELAGAGYVSDRTVLTAVVG
jgi:hypothetical protein